MTVKKRSGEMEKFDADKINKVLRLKPANLLPHTTKGKINSVDVKRTI